MLIKRALNKKSWYKISLKLVDKFSRGISYSSQIVFFQLLHYTYFSGAICPLQVPDLTLSGPRRGGGGGGSEARMTKPIRNLLFYDAQTLRLLVFIRKTGSDQILAKLISPGVAAALFSSRCPKKFENEKVFLCLKIAEIDTRGSILGREERFWT